MKLIALVLGLAIGATRPAGAADAAALDEALRHEHGHWPDTHRRH